MAELADALDSGSSEQYAHAGSSPVIRIFLGREASVHGFFVLSASYGLLFAHDK